MQTNKQIIKATFTQLKGIYVAGTNGEIWMKLYIWYYNCVNMHFSRYESHIVLIKKRSPCSYEIHVEVFRAKCHYVCKLISNISAKKVLI